MSGQRPSVGRIVHYLSGARAEPLAAIVTGVFVAGDGGDIVTLTVFPPGEHPRPLPEAILEGTTTNTWCWPPVVPLAQVSR